MPSPEEQPIHERNGKPTVLLADDDEDQRYLMGRLLQRAGFETVMVDSGDRVLSAAHTASPDVILLDVQMPGLDGFTTCRKLKDDPRLASVPVLFLSGRMDEHDRRAALEAGAEDCLSKGVDARELVRRVQQLARR